ncbi:hypothetical protein KCU77_g540, partial [Aureobasidium melanogenum]
MSEQQASAGASIPNEQVIAKHFDHQDASVTDQQAPVDKSTDPITHSSNSPRDNHAGDLHNSSVKIYTSMLEHFSKGNTEEGEKLAQGLVFWGPYPEKVHARLFLAQGTQDALMHACLACKEAAKAIAKYGETDNEKFKLLDLALRTRAQAKAEEGLGVIEEVDEEDGQIKNVEKGSHEVKEGDGPKVEKGGSGKVI